MESEQTFNDDRVQVIISRLKFMSKIKTGEKINIRELYIRDNESVVQRFLRSIKNYATIISGAEIVESKDATLQFIRETLNTAIDLIIIYKGQDDQFKNKLAELLIKNLEDAKGGISNIINTYNYDRKFLAEASATIETIEAKISSMKEKKLISSDTLTDLSFMLDRGE